MLVEYTTDIIVTRGKSTLLAGKSVEIYIDGQKKDSVENGESVEITIPNGEHKISTRAHGEEIQFSATGGKIMFAFDDKSKELVLAGELRSELSRSEQTSDSTEIKDIIMSILNAVLENPAGRKLIVRFIIAICATLGITTGVATVESGKSKNIFTDTRDSQTYRIAKIGEQTWLAGNLNYNAEGSKCYDNKPENCKKYGRLYDWQTAMKACPGGWHLPSNEEWDKLRRFAGGARNSFAALPGGCGFSFGSFSGAGNYGLWWGATDDGSSNAYGRIMYNSIDNAGWNSYGKTELFSVRCVKD